MRALCLLVLSVISMDALRPHSMNPFPYKEELDFLTSEEEERLIFGRDMSVIHDKIKDMPDQTVDPPIRDELPIPTMDPPLPKQPIKKRPPKKSNKGFPFKIPRALSMLSRMTAPLKRKPRMRSVVPVPTYRSRPSTLVSSDPDQLEIAFKRIEIMASRAGLNMSAMPRTTQMQVLKRLMPKLPPRMSHLVKNAMESNSNKMYHYLPEPMKEPSEPETNDYFNSYQIKEDVHDEFESPASRPEHSTFDAGKVSITSSSESDGEGSFGHYPTFTVSQDSGGSSSLLLPPSELTGHGDYNMHVSSTYDRSSHHGHDEKSEEFGDGRIVASPLVSEYQDPMEVQESENLPVIISTGSTRNHKAVKISSIKSSTLPPIRVSLPTKEKIGPVRPTPRPIRVSIISKETISANRTEPVIKVIHVEAAPEDDDEVVSAHVQEVKDDPPTPSSVETEVAKIPSRVKEISTDIIKEEEAKYVYKKERKPEVLQPTTTERPSTTTTPTPEMLPPDLHKLDMYDDWSESSEDVWSDPYDLSDDEIAATVAELKKYEEQGIFDNSLEEEFPWRLAPHPLEYPDHPDHPKDSTEEVKVEETENKEKVTAVKTPNQNLPPKRPPPGFERGPMRRPPFGMHRRPPMRRPFLPKRPHPYHIRRPPRPPPGPRPFRINEVTVSEIPKEYNKECDYFSEDLCLVVQDYPIEAISEAMEKHADSSNLLVKEPEVSSWVDGIQKTQENSYNFKHYFGIRRTEDETTHRHRDFAGEGGFLCPSKVAYGQVKKAKSSSTGDWKYVVNYGDNTQTLRLEKCLSPGNTCSYVMPHYRTACTQVYNYHRLLAWDPEKGLHVDVFKVPTCCTCHVQGYYIPQQQHGFTPARRRDLPPRLKFAPPRTPMGRGSKKIPPNLPTTTILKPVTPSKPITKALTPVTNSNTGSNLNSVSASHSKDLKDDLQDLLAQYSALREKIAKKKNENIQVSYSVSVSNGTDSLKPKTRESRTSQYSSKLKPLLKLKKLTENLKKLNSSSKPLVRAKLKRPLARALLLARLNRKLKFAKSRRLRGRSMKVGDEKNNSSSKSRLQNRIQMLRTRLNKYNERRRDPETNSMQVQHRLRAKAKKSPDDRDRTGSKTPNSSTNQKMRDSSNRPSKVNYSYHPIMDYFNSKPAKRIAE